MKIVAVSTPDGPFMIMTHEGKVVASGWTDDIGEALDRLPINQRPRTWEVVPETHPDVAKATAAVAAYYAGDFTAITQVPVHHYGTDFQHRGWTALRGIPAGHPLSYADFAKAIGRPKAVRAAAAICARNAPALFVPCHRVLRTDGDLGGFAWGLDVKRSLLAREATQANLD